MSKSIYPYAFFEGKTVKQEKANIHISSNALQYGNTVFSGIRGYLTRDRKTVNIFRLKDHYGRFLKSLKILDRTIPYTLEDLMGITLKLARKNRPDTDTYFRPFAYGREGHISPDLHPMTFDFALYMVPLGEYLSVKKGLKLAVSSWMRPSDNMIPSRAKIGGGYINSSLAKSEAVKLGFDDALMLDSRGHIAEGSAANFFMVRDGVLVTPPLYSDILEGMTRRTVLELAGDLRIPYAEREIDRTECYIADEAFFTGTGAQVAWIKEIDGRIIGDGKMGPVTGKLQKLFFDIVRGREKRYGKWLTRVQ